MIKIIAIGTKMPSWIDSGILHYQKQLKNLEIITIKSSNKKDEGEKLLKKASGFIVAMDENGVNLTSTEFAKKIDNWRQDNLKGGDISFLIGGAFGHSDLVKNKANLLISLGKMTMPHSLARLVLVEQVYRANSILSIHPYHKQ